MSEASEEQATNGFQLCLEDFSESAMEWLQGPEAEHARGLIVEVIGILQAEAIEPQSLTLVLANKFADAVHRRSDDGELDYDTKRLGGMTAAKTMPRDDGRIDIVVLAPLVFGYDDEDEDARATRSELLLHTAAHEAQHVGMRQRGEALHDAGRSLARGQAHANFCASAAIVIEEHRAEFAANTARRPIHAYWESVPETLDHLTAAFRDAVVLRFPGESMDRPMTTAFGAAHDAWISMAYLAAHQRTNETIAQLPSQLASDPLWQRFMALHWTAFAALCARLPAGDASADRSTLEDIVLELADLLSGWFVSMGFGLRDLPDEGMYFDVHRHDF